MKRLLFEAMPWSLKRSLVTNSHLATDRDRAGACLRVYALVRHQGTVGGLLMEQGDLPYTIDGIVPNHRPAISKKKTGRWAVTFSSIHTEYRRA